MNISCGNEIYNAVDVNIFMDDPDFAVVLCIDGMILYTKDGGEEWTRAQSIVPNGTIPRVYLFEKDYWVLAVLAMDDPYAFVYYVSQDFGDTWQEKKDIVPYTHHEHELGAALCE